MPNATVKYSSLIIQSLNPKKATGLNSICFDSMKIYSKAIDIHLCNIINKDLEKNRYSEESKKALARPIYKNIKKKTENNILNRISRIYKKFVHSSFSYYAENFLSNILVSLILVETWKKSLESKTFFGTALIDLPKVSDCIPHDSLIAKRHGHGLSEGAVTFLYLYLV